MKEFNIRKPWCRCLSLLMSLVLTITLLSGCGPSTTSNRESQTEAVEQHIEETQDAVSTKNRELAITCETLENTLLQLETDLEQEDAEILLVSLEEQLAKTQEQTGQWLAMQEEAVEALSKDARKLWEERNAAFEKELAANQKQAETLLADLKTAVVKEDTEEAKQLAEELKNLLVQEEAPKTYGDTLPGEAEVYEPQVAELDSTEEVVVSGDASEVTELSEKELTDLLVTKEDTELNEELIQLTNELGTPLAIYNYVKNNMGYEYYYGSRKGAVSTYEALAGNDFDQASLLIAMLRHIGVEAQYVRGNIRLNEEQATALTGADTISHAADVLAAPGTPVTKLTLDGEVVALSMEHIWVRAYVPYTDYRGAGKAAGERVWIDLDTGIKAYEEVENLYDLLEEEGFSEEVKEVIESGDVAAMEGMLDEWESALSSKDLENVYARKRIIQQEELSYLPLSLQYEVEKEIETFAHTDIADKDSVSFAVGGETLGTYTASELSGKDIVLSFRPVSDADAEILNSYASIFDVPAHSVYLKPVLLINGEVVAEGEDIGTTLGTSQTFSMTLHSGGKDTVVDNAVTTGSMYAITLDNQSITGAELQRVYDEAAALKDTVSEDNVYSEEYLGKLLALAGKLYFAQVDITDTVAAEIYGVNQTRSLSEGITGYEVRPTSLYGITTGISEGSLYIDVDTDSHSVVSLTGEEDTPKEYMFSTGMLSSLYESVVWEELTGIESVSTISILAKAQEEGIDILLISKNNLDTEIEKLNTDETTKQTVVNAVNSGKIVTIPATDITMGEWNGTGYIITNPETGAGAYMISGGLNGGSSPILVGVTFLVNILCSVSDIVEAISLIIVAITSTTMAGPIAVILAVAGLVCAIYALLDIIDTLTLMYDYVNGDIQAGEQLIDKALLNVVLSLAIVAGGGVAKQYLKTVLKSRLYAKVGSEFTERMLKEYDDIYALTRAVQDLLNMKVSVGVLIEISEKFGKAGLDWLLSKKGLGLTDELIRKILKASDLSLFTDDVIKAILNSSGYADDIIELIIRYGKSAANVIVKYGDDVVEILVKYGDDAAEAIEKYGDEALELIEEYGDEAVDGFKKSKTPDEVRADVENADSGGNSSGETGGSNSDGDAGDVGSDSGYVTSADQYAELVSDRIEIYGDYSDSYTASEILRQELYLAGVSNPPYKNAAHHIVLWNDPRAAEAREILESYGIHYNSASNGVLLPMETNAYTGNATLHIGNHSLEYVEYVTRQLKEVVAAGGDLEDVIEILNNIRKGLLNGTISLN